MRRIGVPMAGVESEPQSKSNDAAFTQALADSGERLVVMPDNFMHLHRAPTISAAARNIVPADLWAI
jgi:hypothetical protein